MSSKRRRTGRAEVVASVVRELIARAERDPSAREQLRCVLREPVAQVLQDARLAHVNVTGVSPEHALELLETIASSVDRLLHRLAS